MLVRMGSAHMPSTRQCPVKVESPGCMLCSMQFPGMALALSSIISVFYSTDDNHIRHVVRCCLCTVRWLRGLPGLPNYAFQSSLSKPSAGRPGCPC